MKREVFLYVLPVGILFVASVIVPFLDLPQIVRVIPAGLLIVIGLAIGISGLLKSLNESNPSELSGYVGRKEFYGFVLVLVGWIQVWITHFNSRIDSLYALLVK